MTSSRAARIVVTMAESKFGISPSPVGTNASSIDRRHRWSSIRPSSCYSDVDSLAPENESAKQPVSQNDGSDRKGMDQHVWGGGIMRMDKIQQACRGRGARQSPKDRCQSWTQRTAPPQHQYEKHRQRRR